MTFAKRDIEFVSFDWKFTFGKHKGRTIRYVLDESPSYIIWVRDNVDWLELDTKVVDEALELMTDELTRYDNYIEDSLSIY